MGVTMSNDDTTQTVEVPLTDLSDYGRAKRDPTPEAVAGLSKNEAIYTICEILGVDTPEGHPSDHNGNVPKSLVQEWVNQLAAIRVSYSDPTTFDDRVSEVGSTVPPEDSDEGDA